ncbi:uncharacterized protein LOC122252938 [Penaeus japonicus]|uniref:uncharacterized protein LOC122252938 n=1 Tax=Penaeus japonicus TaxID=27405 RepID=UPI001C712E50|nr:uncharacterized protein LOC122252938 [Penaeus japonicus]
MTSIPKQEAVNTDLQPKQNELPRPVNGFENDLNYNSTILKLNKREGSNIIEGNRNLQESTGITRNLQESPGITRNHQEPTGIYRNHQESPGIYRNHQESPGIYRNHQESPGITRNHQESTGITRNHQESTGIYRNHQESTGIYRSERESDTPLPSTYNDSPHHAIMTRFVPFVFTSKKVLHTLWDQYTKTQALALPDEQVSSSSSI